MSPNPAPSNPQPQQPQQPRPRVVEAKTPPTRPRVVVPRVSRRDILIGTGIAVILLGFVIAATFQSKTTPRNMLSGVIRAKNEPGLRETLMTVSRKGVTERTADTGYSLKVWVEPLQREYEVMVMQEIWEKKKIGDTIEFLRPASEQK